MQKTAPRRKQAGFLPKLAMAALISLLPLTSTLAQDKEPQQQLERRIHYNSSEEGTLLRWMKSSRQKQMRKPKFYYAIPMLLNFNSSSAGAYLRTKSLVDKLMETNNNRPTSMQEAESDLKDLQKIPKTNAYVKFGDEVVRLGWIRKGFRLDCEAGPRLWADYSYSGIGKYAKHGDTLVFSSANHSLYGTAALDIIGGVQLTLPCKLGSGTLSVAPKLSCIYRIGWQGYVLVGDTVAKAQDVLFLPPERMWPSFGMFTGGLSASFEPEKKPGLLRFLSPQFGVSYSGTGIGGKKPQHSAEFGVLTFPGGLLDAGMSVTVSQLAPQYRMEFSGRPFSEIGLSFTATFNKPGVFLEPQTSYCLTFTYGNNTVHFTLPLSYSSRGGGVGIGLSVIGGSNLWQSPR